MSSVNPSNVGAAAENDLAPKDADIRSLGCSKTSAAILMNMKNRP